MQRQRFPASASSIACVAGVRIAIEQVDHGDDHAGRAEPALHRARLDERLLNRVQGAVRRRAPRPFEPRGRRPGRPGPGRSRRPRRRARPSTTRTRPARTRSSSRGGRARRGARRAGSSPAHTSTSRHSPLTVVAISHLDAPPVRRAPTPRARRAMPVAGMAAVGGRPADVVDRRGGGRGSELGRTGRARRAARSRSGSSHGDRRRAANASASGARRTVGPTEPSADADASRVPRRAARRCRPPRSPSRCGSRPSRRSRARRATLHSTPTISSSGARRSLRPEQELAPAGSTARRRPADARRLGVVGRQHRQAVAGRRGGAEVAADRRPVADLRRADGPRGLGQRAELGQLPHDPRKGHPRADEHRAVSRRCHAASSATRERSSSAAGRIRPKLSSTISRCPPATGSASGWAAFSSSASSSVRGMKASIQNCPFGEGVDHGPDVVAQRVQDRARAAARRRTREPWRGTRPACPRR